jgi:hypothetical protein
VLALAIGVVRYFTGPEWAFSAFYLFPIILATWKAGIGAGILLSFTSAISWLLADLMMAKVFRVPSFPILNDRRSGCPNVFRQAEWEKPNTL